jgi:hypothetical protein
MLLFKGKNDHAPNWKAEKLGEIVKKHQGKLVVGLSKKAYGSFNVTKEYPDIT